MSKLTKSQQQVLDTLKSNPGAFISYSWISGKYALWTNDEPQRIKPDTFYAIQFYLEKLPYDRRQRDRYTVADEVSNGS